MCAFAAAFCRGCAAQDAGQDGRHRDDLAILQEPPKSMTIPFWFARIAIRLYTVLTKVLYSLIASNARA